MSASIPAGVYGRRIPAGGIPILAAIDPSAAFRITMASLDPNEEPQIDEEHKIPRATLKIIRVPMDFDDDSEDDEDYDPEDIEAIAARLRKAGALPEADSDVSDEDDSEDEKNGGPSDPVKSKKAKQAALTKKLQQELEADEMEIDSSLTNGVNGKGKAKITADDISDEDEDEDEDDEDDEPEEFVLCTLDPERHYQQPLDITVREGEEVYLSVSGTHDIYVTGNYVAFPDDDSEDEADGLEGLGYDLSADDDDLELSELDESEEDELDDLDDPRITEVDSEDEAPKLVEASKKSKKRAAESEDDVTLDDLISKTNGDAKLSKKQAKKLKKNDGQAVASAAEPAKKADKAEKADAPGSDKKKVQFAKNLEQGPTGSPKVDAPKEAAKGPRNVSGVTVDDKKEGKGKAAKKGDRVEMRYIGKLKNGKVFDSNKKGKPFSFKLGVGQVIKGWDIGVAGMTAGGERRLTIPAALAYGKKGAPPDIPANSDLIFDIKCISVS
ncbi:hypothetical protein BKA66DRAFT_497814 [Pyrenochaeta sp. MPI-SDFR-AT-0127]|nr:hypothetical protein BKA66DRAFT_497814 [Pyrenochaeta sp. MPI-SDFR-AT-0127]